MDDKLRYEYSKKASIMSIIGNIILTILKAIIGVFSGSMALVADAFHSGSDLIGTIILLKGLKIAHMPPDESHPYGHHRAETITSKILAILLILTAVGIGYGSFNILLKPNVEPPEVFAIYIVVLSIIMKEAMYQYAYRIGKLIESDAIIADAWNHRSDAFSSIGALIGVGGAILGYPIMDPLAGIFVSILILKTGISIYVKAVSDLMDTAPSEEIINKIKEAASNATGVECIQDIKVRKHGSKLFVDLKICVDSNMTVAAGHGVAARAKENILKMNYYIQDVLVHVNPCYKETGQGCNDCTNQKKNQE